MTKRCFLGGTCNGSLWRNSMKIHLYDTDVTMFNPVVEEWDDEAKANEIRERENCDFVLYTITPKMTGVYSIAELVEDSVKRSEDTIMVMLRDDMQDRFTDHQWDSLISVGAMVYNNGAQVFDSLKQAADYMREETFIDTESDNDFETIR